MSDNYEFEIIYLDFTQSTFSRHFSIKQQTVTSYCRHHCIEIDEQSRVLTCQRCGKVIDAYDHVLMLAKTETRLYEDIARLNHEYQQLTIARDKLKVEIRNLKSRLKASSHKTVEPKIKRTMLKTDRKNCLNEIKEKLKR